ncbi:MAG: ASPIC/UnbV domain-containing [Planctomycetota bacterium]|nr:MAG: ASPIC/UnbV domain-containing [Planctomycetota bacterium]
MPEAAEIPRRRLVVAGGLLSVVAAGLALALLRRGPTVKAGEFVPRPKAFVADIVRSEDAFDIVNPAIKGTFVKGLKGRDWGMVAAALTPDFKARWPKPRDGKELPDAAVVLREYRETQWADSEAAAFIAILKEHVDGWSAVERTTWRPFEFLMDTGGLASFASIHFQVAGVRPDGTRADLAGIVRAQFVSGDGKAWKVRRMEWVEGCRGEAKHKPWRDVTEACGLMFHESDEVRNLRAQIINDRGVAALGGLLVCDWNGDGFYDVLATRAETESALFLNDGKGGFVRAPTPMKEAREAGFSPLRVDLDNDGVDELVTGQVLSYEGQTAFSGIYVQENGGWTLRPKALAAPLEKGVREVLTQAVVPMDVDGNGFLDLYVCNYSNAASLAAGFNRVASYDGMDNWLFMNYGKLDLREESQARGMSGTQYTYLAKAFDFDGDGDLDVFEGNDFGPNHLWLNDGKANFADAKDHIFDADSNYTMGVTLADWDNTGDWTLYISNMYSHAGNRIVPLAKDLSPDMKRLGMILAQGNQMYERLNGVWSETAMARGTNWADWGWGCLFFDADNDADKDLFVANGYTTNTDPKAPDY